MIPQQKVDNLQVIFFINGYDGLLRAFVESVGCV